MNGKPSYNNSLTDYPQNRGLTTDFQKVINSELGVRSHVDRH